MKLRWLLLFGVLSNAEQVIDVRSQENVNQAKQMANLDENHFRLLANPVNRTLPFSTVSHDFFKCPFFCFREHSYLNSGPLRWMGNIFA
jgi:hypothetical protein